MYFRQIYPLTTEIPHLDSEVMFFGVNFRHLVTKKFRNFLFSKCKFDKKNTKKNCQTFETTILNKREKEQKKRKNLQVWSSCVSNVLHLKNL